MFKDRYEAGQQLASSLKNYESRDHVIVLGLARGGVEVAVEVAKALHLPLNVLVPRKIGAPGNPELALGAVAEHGEGVFNSSIIQLLGVSRQYLAQEVEKEKKRAEQRLALYRQYAPLPELKDHLVILVDDGVATGATMLASIQAMRHAQVKKIVVAVPVSSTEALRLMEKAADEVVCLLSSDDFGSVSLYYRHFDQTSDEEVIHLLKESNQRSVGHG